MASRYVASVLVISESLCKLRRALFIVALALSQAGWHVRAEIPVEGIRDKEIITDRASFRVMPAEGYEYTAQLNGTNLALSTWIDVVQPDYYELELRRTLSITGAREEQLVRFIVRSSERGASEWGLPPWTPFPVIPSARNEFLEGTLTLIAPSRIPVNLEIPVIALVRNTDASARRVNGSARAAGFDAFDIRRGFGSTILPAIQQAQSFVFAPEISGLRAAAEIVVEPEPAWTQVGGALSGVATWPEDSRIHVRSNLLVQADVVLTVGAGTIVKLSPGVEIQCAGKIIVAGTLQRPVLFTPETRQAPWGGFVLRASPAQLEMTGAILTGGGSNPNWFANNPGSGDSHRSEQPLIYLASGAKAALTNCYLVSNTGQAAHGEDAFLSMTGCLVQKCITTGQFNGGAVELRNSAFIEFPIDDGLFADDDNDALYFTQGNHTITDCLVGWAKDDGIDAGSGGAGQVNVAGCWIESCFHEGLAWSGTGRIARCRDTVLLNCGQGVEAGWNSPDVLAEHCLSAGNLVGARFGDNYDWTYDGFLRVTNSFLLFNYRNIWGRNWDDWTERLDQMDVRQNFLSTGDSHHPTNRVWTAEDGQQLATYLSGLSNQPVGVAFALRNRALSQPNSNGIPVGLSRFSTLPVTVEYGLEAPEGMLTNGSLQFMPGQTIELIPPSVLDKAGGRFAQLELRNGINAEITDAPVALLPVDRTGRELIARASEWRYLDTGVAAPADWRVVGFDDSNWRFGRGELGYGDDDEATVIQGGPSDNRYPAAYFRRTFSVPDPSVYSSLTVKLRRDDGAVVYLNGREVFRSNMPAGEIEYGTEALSSSTSETTYFTQPIDPAFLAQGSNAMAIEVHQASLTSSDLSFDLELTGEPLPKLEFQRLSGGALWLFWADSRLGLEEADTLEGPWRKLASLSSPARVTPSSTRFYRVR